MGKDSYRIASFYEFKRLDDLPLVREELLSQMEAFSVHGTFIIAEEGFNATISGTPEALDAFLPEAERVLGASFEVKDSFHDQMPFRRRKVKIKKEIVTLRKDVDISLGKGTHVDASRWNEIITDPETLVLDTRNEYEVKVGRFRNAFDPETSSFSDLPDAIADRIERRDYKRVAMYCTGGIRCEKFAPYLKAEGVEEVFQLNGGILRYLEEVPPEQSLWEGECFVFDERVSVDEGLTKGEAEDPSYFKNRSGDPSER